MASKKSRILAERMSSSRIRGVGSSRAASPIWLRRDQIPLCFSLSLAIGLLISVSLFPVVNGKPSSEPEANAVVTFFDRAKSALNDVKKYFKSNVVQPALQGAVDRIFIPKIRQYLRTNNLTSVDLSDMMDISKLSPVPGVGIADVEISGLDSVQRHGDVKLQVHSVAPAVDVEAEGRFRFHNLTVKVLLAGFPGGNANNNAKIASAIPNSFTLVLTATVRTKVALNLTPGQVFSVLLNPNFSLAKLEKNRMMWRELEVEAVEILPGGDLTEEKVPLFGNALRSLIEQILRRHVVNRVIVNT